MNTAEPGAGSRIALPPLVAGAYRKRLGLISIVACFGGLLFGYDTGVINGALRPMAAELGLTALTEGVVTSSLVFAAAVGALFAGRISDAWGRRTTIIGLAVLFFAGTVFVVLAPGIGVLIAGRIMLGLAVGGASTVVPVFLAELAPYEIRGSITGRNEVAIVIGQLSAFVINAIIGNVFHAEAHSWRIMFAICAIPAICLFVGMLRMPESPRWLVEKGRHEQALAVLKTVRPADRAEAELEEVLEIAREEREEHQIGLKAVLTNKWLLRILFIGIGVAMAQQLTGINSIMYYGQIVLIESGFDESAALIANIAPGIVAVIGGFIALYMMDRVDRRKTFAIGLTLTTTSHLLIGFASMLLPVGNPARPFVILALVVLFVLSMQTFLNVAVWVWLAEAFPLHMRGLGIGVSVFFGWTTNGFLSLFFPSLIAAVGITGAFFIFAGVGAIALLFVITQVPETRGVTLEKLEVGVTTGAIFTVPATRKRRR
ncbi:sugar porter family MFS transporter [Pseudoclavibacter chungangensis]|uniref:Sugar porter family MFS transporter n=1 Tax=Pseudoclavibacter chungangensis TaxID=587635 RepID=A0A7J5BUJ0_9MICO|nr:sugar porter family MFS transporter [Pseudoclavibacter chungangensis]KAB1658027.1 sugar porter family MFS transporter [Pseudoclavibacter chungangensis]NYJ65808.1 sugar porter (SP) family MFS transporter [Pseudoclavibacter chungangensis]